MVTAVTLGQKFAVMQQFDGRLVDTFGLEFVLRSHARLHQVC